MTMPSASLHGSAFFARLPPPQQVSERVLIFFACRPDVPHQAALPWLVRPPPRCARVLRGSRLLAWRVGERARPRPHMTTPPPPPPARPSAPPAAAAYLMRSMQYFPLIGALVGAWGAAFFAAASVLWPPVVAAAVSTLATVWLTGEPPAMHRNAGAHAQLTRPAPSNAPQCGRTCQLTRPAHSRAA